MKPHPVDVETLKACAQTDVAYEIEQYVIWTLNRPPIHPDDEIDLRLRQACFEVAILHLRNLVDFLANDRPNRTAFASDLVADHYFDDGWSGKPEPFLLYDARDSESNIGVQRNVNRHLAHITTTRHELRSTGRAFEWDMVDPELVLAGFVRFHRELESIHPDRAGWFNDSRNNAQNAIQTFERIRAAGGSADIVNGTGATFEIVTSGALDPDPESRWRSDLLAPPCPGTRAARPDGDPHPYVPTIACEAGT